ncbi:MAG: sigma-54-dependent Fis family transcriptional regulator [Spirochaetaceae bacterium]|nr:MAG: sigma-54-dependent Fis family transcriptional regulator [Spirochaetaceae bacterium]
MQHVVLLAVDDDPVQLEIIASAAARLEYPPIEVLKAATVAEALASIDARTPDMVICDKLLPDGEAREVLAVMRRTNPLVPVIVITAHESVASAVDLIKQGARDYLVKPLKPLEIQQVIAGTLAWRTDEADYAELIEPETERSGIAFSAAEPMKTAIRLAARAADSDASILIQGESGTGKELLARFIHSRSGRRDKPFIPVHVAALPESLVESELFGHRKGAFTGAQSDRTGFFEQATSGTLFIDEIAEIPLSVQVKLLRALQFREIQRVGDSETRTVDVRILAASHRELEEMVREGTFREDLYYRVNVITVHLPPLRDRREDIPHLVDHMIRKIARKNGRALDGITQRALNLLVGYAFPGNVRELENIIERSVILSRRSMITDEDLPAFVLAGSVPAAEATPAGGCSDTAGGDSIEERSLDERLESLERCLILEALDRTGGNQSRAAALLKITERRLRSRLERLDLTNPYAQTAPGLARQGESE